MSGRSPHAERIVNCVNLLRNVSDEDLKAGRVRVLVREAGCNECWGDRNWGACDYCEEDVTPEAEGD